MRDEKNFFLTTEPVKLFFRTAIPGAVGMMASNIYFSVEMLLIGKLVGETAFAAGNLALPLLLIAYAVADMVAVGSSIGIAIKLGEGKREEADRLFTAAIFIAVVLSILAGIVLVIASPHLFRLMGADGSLLSDAMAYITVYALFIPFTALVFVLDNYLRICGWVRFSMVINIVMALLCLFFEFLFLYVFDKGIGYAALGTSLGMSITCIICIIPFMRGKMALRFVRLRITGVILHDIFRQGLPSFLNNTSGRITSILMNSLLLHLGGNIAVSIYGVFMNMDGIIVPCMYGIFDSLQPAIGYNWGAGRKDRVKSITSCCVIALAAICLAFTALLMLFPSSIFSLFLDSAENMPMAIHAIRVMGLMYLVRWISYACQSFSSAIGSNTEATLISICSALVFPLAMMAALRPLGLDGVWLVVPAAAFLTSLLALAVYRIRLRRMLI